jgi:hypothetical protein
MQWNNPNTLDPSRKLCGEPFSGLQWLVITRSIFIIIRVSGVQVPPPLPFLFHKNPCLSLDRSLCRLSVQKIILWPEMAFCPFTSDPRVAERYKEKLVSSDFCLDEEDGLFQSWKSRSPQATTLKK